MEIVHFDRIEEEKTNTAKKRERQIITIYYHLSPSPSRKRMVNKLNRQLVILNAENCFNDLAIVYLCVRCHLVIYCFSNFRLFRDNHIDKYDTRTSFRRCVRMFVCFFRWNLLWLEKFLRRKKERWCNRFCVPMSNRSLHHWPVFTSSAWKNLIKELLVRFMK